MANEFYEAPTGNIPLTTIRSADENSDRQSVEAGFDLLPTEADMKRSLYASDDSVAADFFEITAPYLSGAYIEGQELIFEATYTNTGATNIQVNGGSIVELVDINNASLLADAITAGQLLSVIFNSDGKFRLVNSTTDAATATAQAVAAQVAAEAAETGAVIAQAAAEAAQAATEALATIIPHTGGGTLTGMRINELRDGSTYDLPAANSLSANQWIVIELPDTYEDQMPKVDAVGSDLIYIGEGSDTRIIFNSGSTWMRLVSNGTNGWRM
ncbi:MAG: hypothetical protein GY746_11045 [Gammaproteobacteria bacterium]|nr:hypothetical protein [Gammaproteobacteria bacterium]